MPMISCLPLSEKYIKIISKAGWPIMFKGVRALRGYFGPPMRSKNKSCSLQVSSY